MNTDMNNIVQLMENNQDKRVKFKLTEINICKDYKSFKSRSSELLYLVLIKLIYIPNGRILLLIETYCFLHFSTINCEKAFSRKYTLINVHQSGFLDQLFKIMITQAFNFHFTRNIFVDRSLLIIFTLEVKNFN